MRGAVAVAVVVVVGLRVWMCGLGSGSVVPGVGAVFVGVGGRRRCISLLFGSGFGV